MCLFGEFKEPCRSSEDFRKAIELCNFYIPDEPWTNGIVIEIGCWGTFDFMWDILHNAGVYPVLVEYCLNGHIGHLDNLFNQRSWPNLLSVWPMAIVQLVQVGIT